MPTFLEFSAALIICAISGFLSGVLIARLIYWKSFANKGKGK